MGGQVRRGGRKILHGSSRVLSPCLAVLVAVLYLLLSLFYLSISFFIYLYLRCLDEGSIQPIALEDLLLSSKQTPPQRGKDL